MSLQGTVVPGGLRSQLCPWGVKQDISSNMWVKSFLRHNKNYNEFSDYKNKKECKLFPK